MMRDLIISTQPVRRAGLRGKLTLTGYEIEVREGDLLIYTRSARPAEVVRARTKTINHFSSLPDVGTVTAPAIRRP